jgi:ryanodine receptor 2
MKNDVYKPSPLDTSTVELPSELEALVESLARNVHEVWAAGRQEEGWTYGSRRDDVLKQHPGMIEYEQLTESEKDYDRHTAVETLKMIIRLGYEIRKK